MSQQGNIYRVLGKVEDMRSLRAVSDVGMKISASDFATVTKYSNGQAIVTLSSDPHVPGESSITFNNRAAIPNRLAADISCTRARQSIPSVSLVSSEVGQISDLVVGVVGAYQCSAGMGSAYNATAGSIFTIFLASALPAPGEVGQVFLGDLVSIVGFADSRYNISNCCITAISLDRKSFTVNYTDEVVLTSAALPDPVPPAGTVVAYFYRNAAGARNAAGLRFTSNTATLTAPFVIADDAGPAVVGSLVGVQGTTMLTTAPTYVNGILGNVELRPSLRAIIEVYPERVTFYDRSPNTLGVLSTPRATFHSAVPNPAAELALRMRVYTSPSVSRPVARVVNVVKSGTTTATVTIDRSCAEAGLNNTSYVTIKGVVDVTNFPSFTAGALVTVTGTYTFTIGFGATTTGNSGGGVVCLVNGSVDLPAVLSQAIVSVASWNASTQTLSVTTSATLTGAGVGDYVNLIGMLTDLGVDSGLDGVWEITNLNTINLALRPVAIEGGYVSKPGIGALTSAAACGGVVVLRTNLRLHDAVAYTYDDAVVRVAGQGTNDLELALPVYISSPPAVTGGVLQDGALTTTNGGMPTLLRTNNTVEVGMSATADAVLAQATMAGKQVVRPYSIPELEFSGVAVLTTTSDYAARTAQGATQRNYVTAVQYQNTGTVATNVVIKDGSTVLHRVNLPASMTMPADMEFPTPLRGSLNAAINVAAETAGANVLVNIQGHTSL